MIYSNSEIFFYFCLFSKFVILPLISCSPWCVMNSEKTNHKPKNVSVLGRNKSLGAGRCDLWAPQPVWPENEGMWVGRSTEMQWGDGWESCLRALIHHQELWTRHCPHACPKSQPCETLYYHLHGTFWGKRLRKSLDNGILRDFKRKIRHTVVELRLTLPSRGLLTST